MAYSIVEPIIGYTPIANTDAGISLGPTPTVTPTPPAYLGQEIRAYDPTFGEGEFICLLGVAGTTIGAVVIYDSVTYQTTLCPSTANLARPIAIAMSANLAATYGWYQISGSATVLKQTNHQIAANLAVGISSSAGKIVASSSAGAGKEIQGARKTTTGTASSASTTCVIVINRPHMQGRIT